MPSTVNELIEFFEQFEYNVTEDTYMGSWYMGKDDDGKDKQKKKACKYCEKEGHYLFKSLKSSDLTCPMAKRHVELKKQYGTDTRQHIVDKLAKHKIKAWANEKQDPAVGAVASSNDTDVDAKIPDINESGLNDTRLSVENIHVDHVIVEPNLKLKAETEAAIIVEGNNGNNVYVNEQIKTNLYNSGRVA